MRTKLYALRPLAVCTAALILAAGSARAAGENLVLNGGFDDPDEPLKGWKYDYADTENQWYVNNRQYVSVIPRDGAKENVLRLHGTRAILWGTGQGVIVDSKPIPFDPAARYRLTAESRSQADSQTPGPNARMYIEGYRWRPGIRPHPDPELWELRRVYKQGSGNILYFGNAKSGPFSNAKPQWQKGECTFPGEDLSAQAMAHLKRVAFIVVHICAIDGWDGDLLIDNVALTKIGR